MFISTQHYLRCQPSSRSSASSLPRVPCSLQYKRLVRFASARFLRVAAAAEAEVAEEPAQNVDASAAPAEGKQQRGGDNRGRRRTNNYRRPTIGPARTIELANLEIGKTYDGNVVSVTDFGAFVNIGCMTDGLLHISQISVEFVKNVADAVSVGAPVSVRVLSVDSERKKFSVTAIPEGQEPPPRRAQQGDRYDGGERQGGDGDRQSPPRQARQSKQSRRTSKAPCPVAPGDVVTGAVTSIAPFGVFVTLGEGYSGMLHRSQMKLPEGVQDHVGHITEGSEVEVRVVSINKGGEQIRLTQKTDDELAAEEETRVHGLSASKMIPYFVASIVVALFSLLQLTHGVVPQASTSLKGQDPWPLCLQRPASTAICLIR